MSNLSDEWAASPSWVVACLTTGTALFETFERDTADRMAGRNDVRVVPIHKWLKEINNAAKMSPNT